MGLVFRCIAVFFAALPVLFASLPGSAQSEGVFRVSPFVSNDYNYTSEPAYKKMVEDAYFTRPADFRFRNLRSFYTRIRDYDPAGEETSERLIRLSYIVENAGTSEQARQALSDFQALALMHLGNARVMLQAYSLATQDRKYGDPEFYQWVINGILKSVQATGDGLSKAGAYEIQTMGEEVLLLDSLNVRLLETDMIEGGTVLRLHSVESREGGPPYTIFVDATRPVQYARYLDGQQDNAVSLPDLQKLKPQTLSDFNP